MRPSPVVDESLPDIFAFGRSLAVARVIAGAEGGSEGRLASGSPTAIGVAVPRWPETAAGAAPEAADADVGSCGPETSSGSGAAAEGVL